MSEDRIAPALTRLRTILDQQAADPELRELIAGRESCLGRYSRAFSPAAVARITEEEFRSFLLFENNRHWSGLNRKGGNACADLAALQKALACLLDESQPISARVDKVADEVPGMGKALTTAILLVAFPGKYGVWNSTSETSLRMLHVWPDAKRGAGLGERYRLMNEVQLELARRLEVDLWTLDALHWRVVQNGPEGVSTATVPLDDGGETPQRFALERHLHEFLWDNWGRMPLGKEWVLYAEPGDKDAGYEYATDIGRIDILAKHKTGKRWLVVELKRGQGSDDTVGQILRYIAWVRLHLADKGDQVEGLIVCHDVDASLRFAVSEIPHVSVMAYEVSFTLRPDAPIPQKAVLA